MKKIVLIFGLIAGIICGGMFYLMNPHGAENIDFDNGQLYGYITMVIALSSIFFAVKQYRDKHLNGEIKFGKAFVVGLLVTCVAGIVYVLSWELYQATIGGEFVEQYITYLKNQMAEQGMTAAEIEAEMASNREMMELYQNNIAFRLAMTFMEIFPVGLIISLISALIFGVILKKKDGAGEAALA